MKRKDAFRKLRTVCQRLDEVNLDEFFIIPQRLYLFGSALTNKPKPTNLNLMLEYRDRPDNDPEEMYYRLMSRRPFPIHQAIKHLRQGMKMVAIMDETQDIDHWLRGFVMPEDVQVCLIWEPHLAWQKIVDAIEKHPRPWDEAKDNFYKQINKQAQVISQEKHDWDTHAWIKEQVLAYHGQQASEANKG